MSNPQQETRFQMATLNPYTEVLKVSAGGMILARGVETKNPWVIGKAFLEWVEWWKEKESEIDD